MIKAVAAPAQCSGKEADTRRGEKLATELVSWRTIFLNAETFPGPPCPPRVCCSPLFPDGQSSECPDLAQCELCLGKWDHGFLPT